MSFPAKFIHWIRLCITTASFSVQVNSELAGFFRSQRGLRQGCSLSPYLFVICMNVLSKLLDKAAADKRIGYHPKCKSIKLTHLCFADDLMVFVDGHQKSVEGIIKVFDEYAGISGLEISVEKSTLFMAGISEDTRSAILHHFPFAQGNLPVRYLGLPLLTKQMTRSDYLPLMEKLRSRISSWTTRHLSYAGRLQLLQSVITSITNFWISAYRLPSRCIKEINQLCSAFLWSGPNLNTKKAKVAWTDVCRPKKEGGLGLQSIREANKTCCLKLIWRILTQRDSIWVKWTKCSILKQRSFWELKENTSLGSWMWRKLLKYRDIAKQFYKVEIQNGKSTSFWFDNWSSLGCLYDITGNRGFIDMGIPSQATVASVKTNRYRRRHRTVHYNQIEDEIGKLTITAGGDIPLWRASNDKHMNKFSTRLTKKLLCIPQPCTAWYRCVWFTNATPKYSFLTWLAIQNRLATGDRICRWNSNQRTDCVFCGDMIESQNHIFFSCRYSAEIWTLLAGRLLGHEFSLAWDQLLILLNSSKYNPHNLFTLRYAFQASIYHIWRERNGRRHGEHPLSTSQLGKLIDKNIRNRFSSIRSTGDFTHDDGLTLWFATRPPLLVS